MPPAIILNTASKAATTGGTFADTLTASSGDSLAIPLTDDDNNFIHAMWGIDSDSVAELALTDTRSDSVHDPQYGDRFNIPALIPGGAASVASHYLIRPPSSIQVFPGDALTMTVTTTAADDILVSWLTRYNALPGQAGQFARWEDVMQLKETDISCACNAVASGTAGLYGTARAFSADDNRWTGGKFYALLGWTQQTVSTTVAFSGNAWSNNKIGGPGGALTLDTTNYFIDLYRETGIPCIPVFNGYDAAQTYAYVADGEASTSPKLDLRCYQLRSKPAGF